MVATLEPLADSVFVTDPETLEQASVTSEFGQAVDVKRLPSGDDAGVLEAIRILLENGLLVRADPLSVSVDDLPALFRLAILQALNDSMWIEPGTSRLRVVLDPSGGAQTLAAVTTVSAVTAVTTLSQLAGFDAKLTLLNATERNLWANAVRPRIT